jgi:hypothetical protein
MIVAAARLDLGCDLRFHSRLDPGFDIVRLRAHGSHIVGRGRVSLVRRRDIVEIRRCIGSFRNRDRREFVGNRSNQTFFGSTTPASATATPAAARTPFTGFAVVAARFAGNIFCAVVCSIAIDLRSSVG